MVQAPRRRRRAITTSPGFIPPQLSQLVKEAPDGAAWLHEPLVLSRVHWVRPEMVVEVSYLTWTEDGLLRHVVYLGERQDNPAAEVWRGRPDGATCRPGTRIA
jgi:ATP-dependent DNA ligase